jgi:hypothetical protein
LTLATNDVELLKLTVFACKIAPVLEINSTVGTETKFVPVIVMSVAVLGIAVVGLIDE